MSRYPRPLHTVLDSTDVRAAAEFYRELLGLFYRPGDEAPTAGEDWLVLTDDVGARVLAFQAVDALPAATWPAPGVPQQLHLDYTVDSRAELERHRARAETLGARLLLDRTDDPDEPRYVLADLDGHPFCLFVAAAAPVRTVMADLLVPDLDSARRFWVQGIGLAEVPLGLDRVTRFADRDSGAAVQAITRDAVGPDEPALTVQVADLPAVRARLAALGLAIEYGPVREPWGVERLFVRTPEGTSST